MGIFFGLVNEFWPVPFFSELKPLSEKTMSFIYRYFMIIVACAAILVGIQIPSFVDQYEKRLDAHFREVAKNIKGYQDIADQFHNKSMEALIKKHETSSDPTFREEAKPIRLMYERYVRFSKEKLAMDTDFIRKVLHLILARDNELFIETREQYSFAILLNRISVVTGVGVALAILILLETLCWSVRRAFGFSRRPNKYLASHR